MEEPITLGGIMLAGGLLTIAVFVLALLKVLAIVSTDKLEEWKERQPDWDSDWDLRE